MQHHRNLRRIRPTNLFHRLHYPIHDFTKPIMEMVRHPNLDNLIHLVILVIHQDIPNITRQPTTILRRPTVIILTKTTTNLLSHLS